MSSLRSNQRLCRQKVSELPVTPDTTFSSSELDVDLFVDAHDEPKASFLPRLYTSGAENRNIGSFIGETIISKDDDIIRERHGCEFRGCSDARKQIRMGVDDENSIIASEKGESVRRTIMMTSDPGVMDFMLEHKWDSSFSNDSEKTTGSEIQAAIDDIRREASQIDQLILYDQLKTLECELDAVNKQYSARSTENDALRAQLEEKEDRVATLELERDLHQADALKLREDLKTCVEKIFDISLYESTLTQGARTTVEKGTRTLLKPPSGELRIHGNRTSSHFECDSQPQGPRVTKKKNKARLPTLSDPGSLTLYSKQWSGDSDSVLVLPSRNRKDEVRDQRIFRQRGRSSCRRRKNAKKDKRMLQNRSGKCLLLRSRSLSNERRPSQAREEYDNREQSKICGLFRRRSRYPQASKDSSLQTMRNQLTELQEMMNASLSASEKLRKRLATISRYYEGVIGTLQDQVVQVKAEKTRTEAELRNELCEADRRIRSKNEEIARLNATLLDQGEV